MENVKIPETRSDYAYKAIREKIVSGDLVPGQKVEQAMIAREIGISETPVREALKKLTSERLLEYKPHNGVIVRKVDVKEISEILEVRAILESAAAEKSFPNLAVDNLLMLDKYLESMTESEEKEDYVNYGKLNKEFHAILYSKCQNAYLIDTISKLWDCSEIARSVFKSEMLRKKSKEDHQNILSLLRSKRFDDSIALLKKHKFETFKTFINTLE